MKNTILKTINTMLAILLLTVFTQISASAQAEADIVNDEKSVEQTQAEDSSLQRRNARALEGVWNHTNTRRNCATGEAIQTFAVMHTYMRGGTMSDWGAGTPPSLRSNGQGIWNYQSQRQYTTAFQFFRFNADGTYAGKQVVREQIQLSPDGNSYTATATAQVFDVNGNVIANNCSTGTATRFE
ncbi:MAG TPA: hypothetical protein VF599_05795 [Pyrinomonadaceae bacterium]|jgi:hypothetical protein